jgi:hypothetical protein
LEHARHRLKPHRMPEAHRIPIGEQPDQLHALASNLANFLRTLALPEQVEHWSLTTLREKLAKIGSRIVRHGRYVVFQPAEVAVPRALFAESLGRIDRLRPRRFSHDRVGARHPSAQERYARRRWSIASTARLTHLPRPRRSFGGPVHPSMPRRPLSETRIRRDEASPSRAIILPQSTTHHRSPPPW